MKEKTVIIGFRVDPRIKGIWKEMAVRRGQSFSALLTELVWAGWRVTDFSVKQEGREKENPDSKGIS